MAEIVNLRRARKARKRVDKDRQAMENRAKFGRPQAETDTQRRRKELDRRRIDGHKLPRKPD